MNNLPKKLRRIGALLPALFLALSLLPLFTAESEAAFSDAAMDKLVNWGIVNGYPDGGLYPNRSITRAEFVAMVNRAYGYKEVGAHPFRDVPASAWYSDDIGIAYNVGYFTGVARRTAAPSSTLTREQAMVLLARNMRLEPASGEIMEFSDGRSFSDWSRGYARAAREAGIIGGYADGSFRPQNNITRGEMAVMLQRALGTLINTPGVHTMSDVYGNVTINTPNTTLRDSTIAGNLYITGGLGLGDVTLDNVRVLGDIIVAGGGESEGSSESIVLRNVEADSLVIDSIADQFVSVRAEGNTNISETALRSDAYVQDRTRPGMGLLTVSLESPDPAASFTLSGNLETVVNRTPSSTLNIATGTVDMLTVDETARGSTLNLDINSTVKTLNLDTATLVAGLGDVETLNVNSAGSTIEMLPDQIVIRPGLTASIAGTTMNTQQGQESSADPRLLAGYPKSKNVAPTSATAVFSANKAGTVYWAVSTTTDGSIGEEDLIAPSTDNGRILQSGNIAVTASSTEFTSALTGLTADANYYLSAVMADARGRHSPVKVASFTTPDNTVPAFNTGYPSILLNTYVRRDPSDPFYDAATYKDDTKYRVQAAAMSNKSCQLYYALYPAGSAAPTAQQFRTGSLGGPLKSGVDEVTKNVLWTENFTGLRELTNYDLYLCLIDADGARSSAVQRLTFRTVDGTPPEFNIPPMVTREQANALTLTANLNEAGTIYWVAVASGSEYPQNPTAAVLNAIRSDASLTEAQRNTALEERIRDHHTLQILAGTGGVSRGSAAAQANRDVTINIGGLTPETKYDIWYLARDAAGNLSTYVYEYPAHYNSRDAHREAAQDVCLLVANTLDNIAPTADQEFTSFSGTIDDVPYANTDVHIIFSEDVKRSNASADNSFLQLYANVVNATAIVDAAEDGEAKAAAEQALAEAKRTLGDALANTIKLYNATDSPTLLVTQCSDADKRSGSWTIDYREAVVTQPSGETNVVVDFKNGSAINLNSGSTYYFVIEDVTDTSSAENPMGRTTLPRFTTISAQVSMRSLGLSSITLADGSSPDVEMSFALTPLSTNVDESIAWDMLIWSDTTVKFELYARSQVGKDDYTEWEKIGSAHDIIVPGNVPADTYYGLSLFRDFYGLSANPSLRNGLNRGTDTIGKLSEDGIYEYAIKFTEVAGESNSKSWTQAVRFRISLVTGNSDSLGNLAADITAENLDYGIEREGLADDIGIAIVGNEQTNYLPLRKQFTDTEAPYFADGFPKFNASDYSVTMQLQLNRHGTVYCILAPVGSIRTQASASVTEADMAIPTVGVAWENEDGSQRNPYTLTTPIPRNIYSPTYSNSDIIVMEPEEVSTGAVQVTVSGLKPQSSSFDGNYYAYFVIKGTGPVYSTTVELYTFQTEVVSQPVLTVIDASPSAQIQSDRTADVDYILEIFNERSMYSMLRLPFLNYVDDEDAFRNYASHLGLVSDSGELSSACTGLWALQTRYLGGAGSVFDQFASSSAKENMADHIRGSSPSGGIVVHTGSTRIVVDPGRPTGSVTIPCESYMSPGTQYIFLAVGRSIDGSADAFSAFPNIHMTDTEAPKVADISVALDSIDSNGKMSGTLSVFFSEPIYYSLQVTDPTTDTVTQQLSPLIAVYQSSTTENTYKNAVSASWIVALTTGVTMIEDTPITDANGNVTTTISELRFELSGVPANTAIRIREAFLSDASGNTRTTPALTIQLQPVRSPDGTYNGDVNVLIPRAWDGRTY